MQPSDNFAVTVELLEPRERSHARSLRVCVPERATSGLRFSASDSASLSLSSSTWATVSPARLPPPRSPFQPQPAQPPPAALSPVHRTPLGGPDATLAPSHRTDTTKKEKKKKVVEITIGRRSFSSFRPQFRGPAAGQDSSDRPGGGGPETGSCGSGTCSLVPAREQLVSWLLFGKWCCCGGADTGARWVRGRGGRGGGRGRRGGQREVFSRRCELQSSDWFSPSLLRVSGTSSAERSFPSDGRGPGIVWEVGAGAAASYPACPKHRSGCTSSPHPGYIYLYISCFLLHTTLHALPIHCLFDRSEVVASSRLSYVVDRTVLTSQSGPRPRHGSCGGPEVEAYTRVNQLAPPEPFSVRSSESASVSVTVHQSLEKLYYDYSDQNYHGNRYYRFINNSNIPKIYIDITNVINKVMIASSLFMEDWQISELGQNISVQMLACASASWRLADFGGCWRESTPNPQGNYGN